MANPKSFLNMSDEELSNINSSGFVIDNASTPETEEDKDDTNSEDNTSQEEVDNDKVDEVADDQSDEDTQDDDDATKDDDQEDQSTDGDSDETKVNEKDDHEPEKGNDDQTTPDEKSKNKQEPEKVADKPAEIDYKAEYEKVMAPFKANGREMTLDSVEDAKALMQMGANYNKKMAALKPSLKILKLLENNGLLDESKLSFLIDLDKKNPEAINKLVQDSGIDPMDITAEKAGEYKPSTYKVDEREMQLDAVLGEIEGSPGYDRTLEVVAKKWDVASQQTIAEAPEVLKIINNHMELGIYDIIDKEMQKEKMLGRLNGLSDIQAYKQVGDAIQERGGFSSLVKVQEPKKPVIPPVITAPKLNKEDEDKRREKKRAASSTKAAAPGSGKKEDYNPLGMSDDEFSKIKPQYL